MKIKLFEKYIEEPIDGNVIYSVTDIDKNGDKIGFELSDEEYNETNPFSLVDAVKIFMKYEKTRPNLIIIKITEELVDNKTIEEVKIKLAANKYNL